MTQAVVQQLAQTENDVRTLYGRIVRKLERALGVCDVCDPKAPCEDCQKRAAPAPPPDPED